MDEWTSAEVALVEIDKMIKNIEDGKEMPNELVNELVKYASKMNCDTIKLKEEFKKLEEEFKKLGEKIG
tara:strand:+ start:590 stop:796 length:207 start_codon:yes stop_codon:yes gene_type:complete